MKKFSRCHKIRAKFLTMGLVSILNLGILPSCSSKKEEETPVAAPSPTPKWDYDKIRQVRDDERASAPVQSALPPEATLSDDCTIVKKAAMQQAKLSGCRKLDPRLGHGEDSYCCPRTN